MHHHHHNNSHYNFTTNSDFPPPTTPTAHPSQKTPSRARASKTPKSTSKDGIKLEAGLGGMNMMTGMGMGMDINMMIDPSLDQASMDLIRQLQQEDLGLRRRQS